MKVHTLPRTSSIAAVAELHAEPVEEHHQAQRADHGRWLGPWRDRADEF